MTGVNPETITAASDENLKVGKLNSNEEWTVVPRRGKLRRKGYPKIETFEIQGWKPTDSESDPKEELKLMQKMQICIRKLESSKFYHTFLCQIETPQTLNYFTNILSCDQRMQMIIYGIGSIGSYETPRLQLALAILMKRKFNWIGDIEVFDPVLSTTESRVLEALGCSVLAVNEQGRRQALKPTMFFMPHCEVSLYNNLVEANWRAGLLNQMVVFGNSFQKYVETMSEFKSIHSESAKHVLAIQRFSIEVELEMVSEDYFPPFHESSWHFFNLNPEMELELQSIKF